MLYKQGFLNEDADIVQITFKTKTNVTGKTGDIKLSDIKASNTGETIEASTISTRITVGKNSDGANMANTSGNRTNTNTPSRINTTANTSRNIANNTNTNRNAQSSYIDSTNNTQNTAGDIPYTGVSDNIMRAIFVVLVIAGISYFKYESIKEK